MILKVLAGKYSTEQTERAILEWMADRDELFALLPWEAWTTNEVSWYRTGDLPVAQVIDPYGTIPVGTTTGQLVRNKVSMIAMNVDVYDIEITTRDIVDRATEKAQAASEAIVRKFKQLLINGDSAQDPFEFDGLRKWVDPDMIVETGADGSPISYDLLDQLIAKFPSTAPPDAIIMHPRTYMSFRQLLRTTYITPAEIQLPNFDGRPVLTFNGIPVIQNEYIPTNLTKGTGQNLTEVYAVRLGATAAAGVYLEGVGRAGGVRLEDLGKLPDVAARRFRLSWGVSIKVQNKWDVAKIEGVSN